MYRSRTDFPEGRSAILRRPDAHLKKLLGNNQILRGAQKALVEDLRLHPALVIAQRSVCLSPHLPGPARRPEGEEEPRGTTEPGEPSGVVVD